MSAGFRSGEIHHVAMSVRDMERTIWFYRDLLGLRMTLDMRVGGESTATTLRLRPGMTGRSVYFQGPASVGQIEAVQWSPPDAAEWQPPRPGQAGVFLLAFHIPAEEMEPLHDRLVAAGVECLSPPRTNTLENYGPIGIFVCLDPDGVMIEFVSLPTRDEVRAFRTANA